VDTTNYNSWRNSSNKEASRHRPCTVLKYSHIANSIERNAQYTEHRTQGKAKSMQDILRNGEYKMVLTTAMGIHTYTDTHIS